MVLITRPLSPSEVDISSIITNADFSSPTISNNSFSTGALTGWTFADGVNTVTNPVRARGSTAYGDPGYSGSNAIVGYINRPAQSQYWLSQNGDNKLYQTITIPTNYTQVNITVDAAGRVGSFEPSHSIEIYLNGVLRAASTGVSGNNLRLQTGWFTNPAGSVELRLRVRNPTGNDSTFFIHGVRILGR